MVTRFLRMLVALWAGSLVTICALVAPSLFAVLADRHLAGELAGHFFRVESWIGIALGGMALALVTRGSNARNRWNILLIVSAALAPILNELALRPFMDAARSAGDMRAFGILHGIGAALFALASLCALALLWRISRPAE